MKQVLLAIGLLAVGLVSCGQPGGEALPRAHNSRTVSLGPKDTGRTVNLDRGDRLLLHLRPAAPSEAAWRLALYPKKTLSRLSLLSGRDGFMFKAVGMGRGQVIAFVSSRAGGACGASKMGIKRPLLCPMGGPEQGRFFPPRPGVFMIKVVVG
jgi:hypothetical protein